MIKYVGFLINKNYAKAYKNLKTTKIIKK